MLVVSDTSPIRALSHLQRFELLRYLFGQVLIPPAVVRELEYPTSRLPPLSITGAPFIRIQAPTDRAGVDQLMEQLESGEAEAIMLALEVHAEVGE